MLRVFDGEGGDLGHCRVSAPVPTVDGKAAISVWRRGCREQTAGARWRHGRDHDRQQTASEALTSGQWLITVVDRDDAHQYQPGYLFLPFGEATPPAQVKKSRQAFVPDGVGFVIAGRPNRRRRQTRVPQRRRDLPYDYLVIASGVSLRADQTPGMFGPGWRKSIFDFYSLDGAQALERGAREDSTVAGSSCTSRTCRSNVRSRRWSSPSWPTPISVARGSGSGRDGLRHPAVRRLHQAGVLGRLGTMLDERKVAVETDFLVEHIDPDTKTLVSYDEREIPFDLLVTVPLNMGADFVARSGMGDELNYVPVDGHTLLSTAYRTSSPSATLRHPGVQGRFRRAFLRGDLLRQLRASWSPGSR